MAAPAREEEAAPAAVKVVGFWASPFVHRVQIVLNLKGVEYEMVEETLGKKSDLLLASNPVHKKVPVLIHNGNPICESQVIVQYIDEVWNSGGRAAVLPADPHARAIDRFWAQYVDDKFPPAIHVLRGTAAGDKDEAASQMVAALRHLEGALLGCCGGHGGKKSHYFGGDDIGYLDIVLGSLVGWVKAAEKIAGVTVLDEASFPELAAWAARFSAHGAVKDVVPDPDGLVEFTASLKRRAAAASKAEASE